MVSYFVIISFFLINGNKKRENVDCHMAIVQRHLSIKRQKASVTCVTTYLNSLLIWFAKYCYVNVFLIATVLYQKLRQVLQITANVGEQIIKRSVFQFLLSSQKREGKIAYQKLKTIHLSGAQQAQLPVRTHGTHVRT